MKTTKGQKQSVSIFQTLAERLAEKLPTKTKPFFLSPMLGALLAVARRRTVTTWLQAAQISDDFRQVVFLKYSARFIRQKFPATANLLIKTDQRTATRNAELFTDAVFDQSERPTFSTTDGE